MRICTPQPGRMKMKRKCYVFKLFLLTACSFIAVKLTFRSLLSWTSSDSIPVVTKEESRQLKLGTVPKQSFDPGYPTKVVILTYQRCGSSFFGQLFNTNPEAFYMFEPLDSFYTATYGTSEGWNVPSDITSYWDGRERKIPELERAGVSEFLKNLLSCNIDALPTETIIHKYWIQFAADHTAMKNYIRCLKTNNIHQANCSMYTPKYCGKRFGEFPQDRMDECHQRLTNTSCEMTGHENKITKDFTMYKQCSRRLRELTEETCIDKYQQVCDKSMLRAVKTVRGTMASMEQLLETVPNFRVIHLVRDPRAVVLSRHEYDNSARGKYSLGDMANEAKLYCRTVVRDIRVRRRLEAQFPGKIINIVYDDLVKEPLKYAENIYTFLNTTLPPDIRKWVLDHTKKNKDSLAISQRWTSVLTVREMWDVTQQCSEFFKELDFLWV